jgi:hypothetical protein
MHIAATDSSRFIKGKKVKINGCLLKLRLPERFRYFIVSTDWDKNFLRREKLINEICIGFIIISVLYFLPILTLTILK